MERHWLVLGLSKGYVNFTEVNDGKALRRWEWNAPKYTQIKGKQHTYYVRYPMGMSEKQARQYVIDYHMKKNIVVTNLGEVR